MTKPTKRSGHAVLDLPSRNVKAMKIARLIGAADDKSAKKMLEIGCGSGGISLWFGSRGPMKWDVEAVDVEDVRLARDGFNFSMVKDSSLPFANNQFDVVISNHVIEHVGDLDEQRRHLNEMRRVLKSDGVAYLAVPNRWMLIEPHFRLPFLSWLPLPLANLYVRMCGKGRDYDCRPLTCSRIELLFEEIGFSWRHHTGDALRLTYELEHPDSLAYRIFLSRVPDPIYMWVRRLFPTLIYTLSTR